MMTPIYSNKTLSDATAQKNSCCYNKKLIIIEPLVQTTQNIIEHKSINGIIGYKPVGGAK